MAGSRSFWALAIVTVDRARKGTVENMATVAGPVEPDPREIPLLEFIERVFIPQRLSNRSRRYADQYRGATTWLARFLDRVPLLDDLRKQVLWQVQGFIVQQGFSTARALNVKKQLSAVARCAWRLGWLPAWEPTRSIRRVDPPATFLDAPPAEGTLAACYRDVVRPKLERRRAERRAGDKRYSLANRPNAIAAAIEAFDRMLGRHGTPEDLTTDARTAFRDRLLERGLAQTTIYSYWRSLKQVARVLVPDPQRQPKAVREQLADRRFTVAPLPPPAEGTLRHFCETVYLPTQLIASPVEVLNDYRYGCRLLYEHAGRDVRLAELSDVLVSDFLRWLLQSGQRRAVTVNRYRAVLMALWRLAAEKHLAPPVQRVRKLKVAVDSPDSFSREELRRMIDAPASIAWRKTIAGIAPEAWRRAYFLVAFFTGMRVRTLLALRIVDVNLETGVVTAGGEAFKTGKGQRFVLPQEAIVAVAEILSPPRELLFAWPTGRREFHKDFCRILAVADVSPSTRRAVTQTHRIRRTIATEIAAEHGVDAAARLLGNTPEVCKKHYIDPTRSGYSTVAAKLPPLLDTPPATPTEALYDDPRRAIDEAHKLYRAGHLAAAAVTARVALHAHLQRLGAAHRIRCPNMGQLATALCGRELIGRGTRDDIHRVLKTANRAAHGRIVGPVEVIDLVHVVQALVAGEE